MVWYSPRECHIVTGIAPAELRRSQVVRIEVREGEDFSDALKRFNKAVHHEHRRRWYKRRYGCYEKPSVLDRKKRKVARVQRHLESIRGRRVSLGLYIGLEDQFQSTSPNAMGY